MKCYRKNGSDQDAGGTRTASTPSMKCYRKNGSDAEPVAPAEGADQPSMKCYRKNGSDKVQLAGNVTDIDPQ